MAAIAGDVASAHARSTCGCCRCTSSCSASRARPPPNGRWQRLGRCGGALRLPITPLTAAGQAAGRAGAARRRPAVTHRPASSLRLTTGAARHPPLPRPSRRRLTVTLPSSTFRCAALRLAAGARARPAARSIDEHARRRQGRLPQRRHQDRAARGAARPDPARARLALPAAPAARSARRRFQAGAARATAARADRRHGGAARQIGDVRIERLGNERWLVTPLTPEQLWPQLQAFWQERGFTLVIDQRRRRRDGNRLGREPRQAAAGHHPQHARQGVRRPLLHRRARQVPHPRRAHRRTAARSTSATAAWSRSTPTQRKDQHRLAAAPGRPAARGRVAGAADGQAGRQGRGRASRGRRRPAPVPTARARVLAGQPGATLQVDDGFDRAWRRVGLALDRSGFTVEDRDRSQGLYFVRYVDPKRRPARRARLLRQAVRRQQDDAGGPARYRIAVKAEGERSHGHGAERPGRARERARPASASSTLLLDDLK